MAFEAATVHLPASAAGAAAVFATALRTAMSSLVGSAVVNTARCTMCASEMPAFWTSPTAAASAAFAADVAASGFAWPTSIATVALWPIGEWSVARSASVTTSA